MPPKRLIFHGPEPPAAKSWITRENKYKFRINRRRHRSPPVIRDIPSPTPGRPVGEREKRTRDAINGARAARRVELRRLRGQEREKTADSAEKSGSTASVVEERRRIRTKTLSPRMLQVVMESLYPLDWRERMAGRGVVGSIETVGEDGFTQYGRLLTKREREAGVVVK